MKNINSEEVLVMNNSKDNLSAESIASLFEERERAAQIASLSLIITIATEYGYYDSNEYLPAIQLLHDISFEHKLAINKLINNGGQKP